MTQTLGSPTSEQQLLDRLMALDRQRATIDAERLQAIADYREMRARVGELAERSVPEEIAIALHITPGQAASQVHLAQILTERLPTTLTALHTGRIDLPKARALAEITGPLSVEDARTVEAKVLPTASDRVLGQVRASARYQRDRIDPEAAEARRQQARQRREVSFQPYDDGRAELYLCGPGERIYLAWLLIDTMARKLQAAGDERTLDQLRHDVMLELLLGQGDQRVQVHAYLHVPATTLAGITADPGILAGYGSVTREACQELASGAALWRRVFTDPATGTVKDVDRRTYRPPDGLSEYVRVRDQACVGPGCMKPAQSCHLDHTVDWAAGGCTCEDNLGPMCLAHHRLKHMCGWTINQVEPGRFVWTSPVGQRYEKLPASIFNP